MILISIRDSLRRLYLRLTKQVPPALATTNTTLEHQLQLVIRESSAWAALYETTAAKLREVTEDRRLARLELLQLRDLHKQMDADRLHRAAAGNLLASESEALMRATAEVSRLRLELERKEDQLVRSGQQFNKQCARLVDAEKAIAQLKGMVRQLETRLEAVTIERNLLEQNRSHGSVGVVSPPPFIHTVLKKES